MPNFASSFKEEVSRVARKELRKFIDPLRKQIASQRRDIAALKREREQLKRKINALPKNTGHSSADESTVRESEQRIRFSASGLQSHRRKLGLSADDFARLAGVSSQSIYNWEHGKARPRQAQLEQIAALRGIGKREAMARLEALQTSRRKRRSKRS